MLCSRNIDAAPLLANFRALEKLSNRLFLWRQKNVRRPSPIGRFDDKPTRSEAIRRLVEIGLKAKTK
jgi:hypothetical protein